MTFRNVLAFQNFILMMGVIFGLQFVDRSFGPVLPLYVEQVGVAHARVPIVAGVLFSIMACTGALGHHFCGRLLKRLSARTIVAGGAGRRGARLRAPGRDRPSAGHGDGVRHRGHRDRRRDDRGLHGGRAS